MSALHTLLIQRDGDDHSLAWYFDSIEQRQAALAHCATYRANVIEGSSIPGGKPPFGDYVTDAEELRVWLAFEYIVDDDETQA